MWNIKNHWLQEQQTTTTATAIATMKYKRKKQQQQQKCKRATTLTTSLAKVDHKNFTYFSISSGFVLCLLISDTTNDYSWHNPFIVSFDWCGAKLQYSMVLWWYTRITSFILFIIENFTIRETDKNWYQICNSNLVYWSGLRRLCSSN